MDALISQRRVKHWLKHVNNSESQLKSKPAVQAELAKFVKQFGPMVRRHGLLLAVATTKAQSKGSRGIANKFLLDTLADWVLSTEDSAGQTGISADNDTWDADTLLKTLSQQTEASHIIAATTAALDYLEMARHLAQLPALSAEESTDG